jgi:hygromycin-B 7''-O-kinase
MEPRVYQTSKRLGPITHEQFSRVLDRHHLGDLIAVEPVPFGLFGQNVFLTTSAGEYVFRGAPHGTQQFPTERFFTQLLHERTGVPVPWPFTIDDACDIFPWSYVIMPRMPGLQVTDPAIKTQLTPTDRIALARAMGRNLAAMHQVAWPVCARFDPDRNEVRAVPLQDHAAWPFHGVYHDLDGAAPAHDEIIAARIRFQLNRALATNDCTTQADADWVEQVIANAMPALGEPLAPCFVMEDYKEGNAVLRRAGEGWEVSGVFDFMGCYFGDGEADLSRTMCEYFDEAPELAALFARTYLDSRPPRPGFAERFPVYMLLDRIIIWAYVAQHEPAAARELGGFRRWAERYTTMAQKLSLG